MDAWGSDDDTAVEIFESMPTHPQNNVAASHVHAPASRRSNDMMSHTMNNDVIDFNETEYDAGEDALRQLRMEQDGARQVNLNVEASIAVLEDPGLIAHMALARLRVAEAASKESLRAYREVRLVSDRAKIANLIMKTTKTLSQAYVALNAQITSTKIVCEEVKVYASDAAKLSRYEWPYGFPPIDTVDPIAWYGRSTALLSAKIESASDTLEQTLLAYVGIESDLSIFKVTYADLLRTIEQDI